MSEEENVYKISFPVKEGFKYANIPEDTQPGSLDIGTKYWESVLDGLQADPGAWSGLCENLASPRQLMGTGIYCMHGCHSISNTRLQLQKFIILPFSSLNWKKSLLNNLKPPIANQ